MTRPEPLPGRRRGAPPPPPPPQAPPPVSSTDRLSLTITLAIILHAIIILGVSFSPDEEPANRFKTLDVTLVHSKSREAPDEATLLAQANQVGGGESEQPERPSSPIRAPLPEQSPEVPAARPRPEPEPVKLSEPSPPKPAPLEPATPRPEPKVVAVKKPVPKAEKKKKVVKPEPRRKPERKVAAKAEQPSKPEPKRKLPDAVTLINKSFAMASLEAEINDKLEARARRPRHKFISSSTREFRFASYMESWRAKVERIGNLNYPDEARRRRLSGSLILDVALHSDGSIEAITIRRSSGHKILDDAAVRIVRLSAPFAPFPPEIAKDVDILHITRTWKFLSRGRFAGR